MRFNSKHYNVVNGETRRVSKFLFLPKTIKGQTRWLEKACWCQHYVGGRHYQGWVDDYWCNH